DARRGPPDRGSARIELPGRGEGGASRGVVSARALVRGYVREGEGVAMDTEQAPRRVRGARDGRLVEAPDESRLIACLPRRPAPALPHERERLGDGGHGRARGQTEDEVEVLAEGRVVEPPGLAHERSVGEHALEGGARPVEQQLLEDPARPGGGQRAGGRRKG